LGEAEESGKTERIAVIVPVYNNEDTLRRCADSILGQSRKELSLYLVDDGSTDGGAALCDGIAAADPRVHVIHKANEGLVASWMRGVKESSEPWLCFVDADDWIDGGMLAALAGQLPCPEHPEAEKREIICCSYLIDREWNGTSEKKGHGAPAGIYEGEKLRKEIREKLLGNEERTVILSRCMKLFSRQLIEDNLRYCDPSIRMGEDVSITVPALLDAERVVILPEAYYYHYTFRAQSMVHRYDSAMFENIRRLRELLRRILAAKHVPDAAQMLRREYLFLFFIAMKNELRNPAGGAVERIRRLCIEEGSPALLKSYPQPLRDRADRLIAFFMRRPVAARIAPVRAIFLIQGRH
jgi:glycosyltransferase involved in cell wall biosynthesis